MRITIDLGSGRAENIVVCQGEEHQADALAQRFCERHGFDARIKAALQEQIQQNIDAVVNGDNPVNDTYNESESQNRESNSQPMFQGLQPGQPDYSAFS